MSSTDLGEGRLVRPFQISIPSRYHYFLVYPPAHGASPEVRAFREFLLDEVQRSARQARSPRKASKSNGSSTARAAP